MLSRISELYNGIVSLRAYNKVAWVLGRFNRCLEVSMCTQLHERMSIAWISFRLDLMVTIICGLTPFVLTASKV